MKWSRRRDSGAGAFKEPDMRIKFQTSIAGENFSHRPGEVVDWPDQAEAVRFVEAGLAVPVAMRPIETPERPAGPVKETRTSPPRPAPPAKPTPSPATTKPRPAPKS